MVIVDMGWVCLKEATANSYSFFLGVPHIRTLDHIYVFSPCDQDIYDLEGYFFFLNCFTILLKW